MDINVGIAGYVRGDQGEQKRRWVLLVGMHHWGLYLETEFDLFFHCLKACILSSRR